jgi:Flp pilus assembly protein TadD
MRKSTLGRIAVVSLLLGTATVACTPGAHIAGPATLGAKPAKADQMAARSAAKARTALAAHKGGEAVAAAERAVSFAPRNADYRMLLGQSYLAAGRFASAQTAFQDTLTLSADQPRAKFDLALAVLAQGHREEALDDLHAMQGSVPAADLGLALTLAGEHDAGIQMLVNAVRQPGATAKTRQNLALAYALDGRWRESRAVAMQDTTPDRINDQIAGWAALASPNATSNRVAAMLGVTPAKDPGQPTALALAQPAPADTAVAVALADPTPKTDLAAPVAPDAPVTSAASPAPVAPAEVAAQIPVAVTPVPPSVAPAAPALLAVADDHKSHRMSPVAPSDIAAAPLLRAPAKAVRVAAIKPDAHPFAKGGWVVQLGAFSKTSSLEAAWGKAQRLTPMMATFSPVRGQTTLSGATLIRLSVGGFSTRAEAKTLCTKIKARGRACFVRAASQDAPMQWAKAERGAQLAAFRAPGSKRHGVRVAYTAPVAHAVTVAAHRDAKMPAMLKAAPKVAIKQDAGVEVASN